MVLDVGGERQRSLVNDEQGGRKTFSLKFIRKLLKAQKLLRHVVVKSIILSQRLSKHLRIFMEGRLAD